MMINRQMGAALALSLLAVVLFYRNILKDPERNPELRRNQPHHFRCTECAHTWTMARKAFSSYQLKAREEPDAKGPSYVAPHCPKGGHRYTGEMIFPGAEEPGEPPSINIDRQGPMARP